MISGVSLRHRVRCRERLRPRVRDVCPALNKWQLPILISRNQDGHAVLVVLMCPLELDSHCFKFLPVLQGTNQFELSQGKWRHHSLPSQGAALLLPMSKQMPLAGGKSSSAPKQAHTGSRGPIAHFRNFVCQLLNGHY